MNLLEVDYQTLTLITVGLFALSGFMRGWWREGMTTVLLVALVALLSQPEWVTNIINFINDLVQKGSILIGTGGDLSASSVQAAGAQEPPIVLDPSSRNMYIAILAGLILLAYFSSRRALPNKGLPGVSYQPSSGARIAGGLIGAFNGFVVINLFKEYIIGRFVPGTGISAQSAAPDTVALQIANVPANSLFNGSVFWLVIAAGIVILVFMLGRVQDISLHGIKTKEPVGYKVVTLVPPPKK